MMSNYLAAFSWSGLVSDALTAVLIWLFVSLVVFYAAFFICFINRWIMRQRKKK